MTEFEKQKEAEEYVRRALSHSGNKVDDDAIQEAARQVARAMPPYRGDSTKS